MSVGNKIGRALGTIGALAVEGTVRGAQGAGRFGQDVVAGTEAGFAEKRVELLRTRTEGEARRKLMLENLRAAHQATLAAAGTGYGETPVVETPNPGPLKRAKATSS